MAIKKKGGRPKLTPAKIKNIIKMRRNGMSIQGISLKMHIARQTIRKYLPDDLRAIPDNDNIEEDESEVSRAISTLEKARKELEKARKDFDIVQLYNAVRSLNTVAEKMMKSLEGTKTVRDFRNLRRGPE